MANKVEESLAPEPTRKGRSALVTRAALVLTLIVALLTVLFVSEKSETLLEQQAIAPSSASAPRIGVAVSASKSSLSEALKEEINNASDVAQVTLENAASSSSSAQQNPPVVPEETSDASLRISDRTSTKVSSSSLAVTQFAEKARLQAPSSHSSSSVAATGQTGDPTGFALQLGVFSNIDNAEALQRKLKRAGIAAQLETRVQLGPFRTKEEAILAQEKLRRLGLASGMMIPMQKRHE